MLRKIKFFIVSLFLIFIMLEFLLRVVFAIKTGPHVLFYGISPRKMVAVEKSQNDASEPKRNIYEHNNRISNYTKYYPNQKRFGYDKKRDIFPVKINRNGFRGKDFDVIKPDGVLRIICLGASSTLGYGNKDNETYPYYLDEMLNEEITHFDHGGIMSVEVINLGIPHLQSDQIFSLFMHEAIRLDPDIVTFYEGINDVRFTPRDTEKPKRSHKHISLLNKLSEKLLIIRLCRYLMKDKSNKQIYSIQHFQEHSK